LFSVIILAIVLVAALLYYSLVASVPVQVEVTGDITVSNSNYVANQLVIPYPDLLEGSSFPNQICTASSQVYSGGGCQVIDLLQGACPPCTYFKNPNGNNFDIYLKNGQVDPLYISITNRNGTYADTCKVSVDLSSPSRSGVITQNFQC